MSSIGYTLSVDQSGYSKESLTEIYQHSLLSNNSILYIYGGEDSNGYWTNRLCVMNIAGFAIKGKAKAKCIEWEKPKFNSFPPKKDGHVICFNSTQKKMFVFGGSDNQHISGQNNALYSLSLVDFTWKIEMKHDDSSSSRPSGRSNAAFSQVKNNLYMFGGKVSDFQSSNDLLPIKSQVLDDFWMLDTDSSAVSWKKLSSKLVGGGGGSSKLPQLSGASLCANSSGDHLFLYGGSMDREYSTDLYKYSIKNDSWECVTSKTNKNNDGPKVGRERHSCVLLSKTNEMVVSGGWIFGGIDSSVYSLNLDSLTWKNLTPKNLDVKSLQRYGHASVGIELSNSEQYLAIIGGKDIAMNNRADCLLLALNSGSGKESTLTSVLQAISQKQNGDSAFTEDWSKLDKLAVPLKAPEITDDYLASVAGVGSSKSTSTTSSTTTSTSTTTTAATATSSTSSVKQPELPTKKPKSTATTAPEKEPSSKPVVTQSNSGDLIGEKLQNVDDKPKLEIVKKGARMQQRKPKTINADLSKLDKVAQQATVDVPDESKFKQLETEAKKIVTPQQQEPESASNDQTAEKKPIRGGVSMFPTGNPMMGELSAKLKKKQ